MSTFTQKYLEESIEHHPQAGRREHRGRGQGARRRCATAGGRLFILGVGGSAGHAGHAVNDFRKLCGFEAYAPTDNVSELTARVNDEGWDTCFVEWLTRLAPARGRRRARLLAWAAATARRT